MAEPPPRGPRPRCARPFAATSRATTATWRTRESTTCPTRAVAARTGSPDLGARRLSALLPARLLASQGVAIDGIAQAQPPPPGDTGTGAPPSRADLARARRPAAARHRLERLRARPRGRGGWGRHGARQSPLPLGWPRALLPGAADDPRQGRRCGREPVRRAGGTDRIYPQPRLEPHGVDRVPLHAVRGEARARLADHVPVRRPAASDGARRSDRRSPAAGQQRTRTLYSTKYGPVFTSLLGLPLFPWTSASAFSMGDVNGGNFRYLNHFF